MADKHFKSLDAWAEHKPPDSGCLLRCDGSYSPGKAHSYRWNGAERARGESRVPYSDYYEIYAAAPMYRGERRLSSLDRQNLLQSPIQTDSSGSAALGVPFADAEHPFPHNAHHIVPRGVLHQGIDGVAGQAEPNVTDMYNLVVGGLLTEPYNLNAQPNVIILPTQRPAAERLGLPRHLDDAEARSHPIYSSMVSAQVVPLFNQSYSGLAAEVAARAHDGPDPTMPAMRGAIEAISNAIYEAIIVLAAALRAKDAALDAVPSLDEISGELFLIARG